MTEPTKDQEPAIDQEEAPSRFLLKGPSTGPVRADAVAAVLAALRPVALVVGDGWDRGVSDVVHQQGVALLVEDDVDLAMEADGVHLSDPSRVAEVRAAFEQKKRDRLILGADVGLSRHDAMVAAEAGADYVSFGHQDEVPDDGIIELVTWWREMTVMPCLAHAVDTETATRLARIQTDFIGVKTAVWDHPGGPEAGARELHAAIVR